jgi:phage-related protein
MLVGLIVGIVLSLWDFIKEGIELIIALYKWSWDTTVSIFKGAGDWFYKTIIKPVADFFSGLWKGIIEGEKNAVKTIKDVFNGIVGFFRGIVDTIMGFFRTIGTNVGNAIGGAFKGVVNGVLSAIEWVLNTPIKTINKLIDTVNKLPGVNLGKLGTFSLPRLAKGGIINMPGRGVPVGSAIAGERGQEGVIPLTDSQQMALLGEAIGKYITINANITNTMNGRVISKELQKIQAENDFAFNK